MEEVAQKAYTDGHEQNWAQAKVFESNFPEEELKTIGKPVYFSLAVDAA